MPTRVPRGRSLLIFCLLGALSAPLAGAAEPAPDIAPGPQPPVAAEPPERPISLEEAIAISLRNHGDILIATENVDAARQRVTQAKTGTLPSVTGGVTFTGRGVTDFGGAFGSGPTTSRTDEGLQPAIEARQTLFDSGQTRLQVRQARGGVRSAQAGLRNTERLRKFQVTSDYIEFLRAQQQLKVREEQVRLAQEQLTLIEARIAVGDAAASEQFPLLRELRSAQERRISAQNNVNVIASALRNSMGLPAGPPVQVAELPDPAYPVPNLQESVAQAVQMRPDLQQDEASVQISQAALSLARVRRRPVASASIAANATPRNDLSRGDWSFFTGVSMPLWDAGLTRARQSEAAANLDSDEARLVQTRKDLTTEVQQAILNLASAQERVEASQATVEAARVALEAANARYQQGLAITVDLTDAQIAFIVARNDQINAQYDYHLSQAQLDRAIGR